jgi:Holliday junction DNA helicase RuvA
MIAHVSGKVVEKFAGALIVDVHGVGYEVQVAAGDFDTVHLNDDIKLYTFHQVAENADNLFGFSSLAAKKLFELLITVQGVGPKAALSILSLDTTEAVRNAVANGDTAYITKASGVGKKTAERVIVDLHDKVGLPTRYDMPLQTELATTDEALEALMALGYTLGDATRALEDIDTTLPTAQRVKQALQGGAQ